MSTHAPNVNKYLLVNHVYVLGSLKEPQLWVHPCFSSSILHILFVLLGLFSRWMISGRTVVVYWGVASRICSRYLRVFLLSSHLTFSFCFLIASMWKKSGIILLDRLDLHMIDNRSIAVHTLSRRIFTSLSIDETLLCEYVNSTTYFRCSSLRVKMASRLKHINSVDGILRQTSMHYQYHDILFLIRDGSINVLVWI